MMKSSKHLPAVTLILVTALIGLLVAIAALQYKWLGKLSESELELSRSALRAGALRFSEDFDHELTLAFVSLQMNRSLLRGGDGEDYTKVYNRWIAAASYPKMISHLYIVKVGADEQLQLFMFDHESCQLEPTIWPASFGALRQRIEQRYQYILSPDRPLDIKSLRLIDGEIPALVIPMAPRMTAEEQSEQPPGRVFDPATFGWIIAVLDLDDIKREVIPALAKRYFSSSDDDGKFDYDLLIVGRHDPAKTIYSSASGSDDLSIAEADVKVDLFRLRLAMLARMFSEKYSSPLSDRSPKADRLDIREPGELPLLPRNVRRQFLRQVLQTSQEGQWQLALIHRAGSLQQAVADVRRRNLMIGFGVLTLLSASIVLIFMLIRRMHLLAKQQMEFVAGVSHELRTPVAVLCSASENLADGMIQSREEVLQYAEMIKSESYQLAELVEQVLEFAGTQSLRNPYQLSPVQVTEVIESTLALSAHQLAGLGFTVERDFQADLPMVMADRAALGRAIQNLLSNAMKFSGDQRLIKVRAQTSKSKHGEEVIIGIEDHGIGIEPHELKQIFEPFHRGKMAVSSQIHGSGLGLSLVKHIVEGHNGRVNVRSIPGRGSAFTLHLPMMSESGLE